MAAVAPSTVALVSAIDVPQVLHYRDMFDPSGQWFQLAPPNAAVHVFPVQTRRRNTVMACMIEVPDPRFTILYSHGNAVRRVRSCACCIAPLMSFVARCGAHRCGRSTLAWLRHRWSSCHSL